ncbi:MAG: SUMF1/EgtB/PvdO family nonheme iron enzyme [Chloroflexota bacterium]|nr:SUMF1/EgtB/PvdO family nonheme iron enzyme [Chloroflexota bacterium]
MVDERLTASERAAAGRELATVGDSRIGVGLRDDGLPDIEWCCIDSGWFTMGSDIHTDPLASHCETPPHIEFIAQFSMSRYPITYQQYEAFVNDSGYQKRNHWSKRGWAWRADKTEPEFGWNNTRWHISNHPIIGVTWFEAYAFTRWLSAKTGDAIRLPTEAEWEKAARGTDERLFSYEGAFDPGKSNTVESGIERSSAVGIFPSGQSPYGVMDMSGNVFEWSTSIWRDHYSHPAASSIEGSHLRVMRGGSWAKNNVHARAAARSRQKSAFAASDVGFRVVRSVRAGG